MNVCEGVQAGKGKEGGGTPHGHPCSLLPIEIEQHSPKEAPSEEEEDGEQDNILLDKYNNRI